MIDTIFSPKRLSKQDVEQLRYIPGTDDKAQYIMEAGIITTESKVAIPIVECRAHPTRCSSTRWLTARRSST